MVEIKEMKIFELINDLIASTTVRQQINGTLLVDVCDAPPPLATHYIYAPISAEIESVLTEQYTRDFPSELLELYRFHNGFNMFFKKKTIMVKKKPLYFPFSRFVCYGVPTDSDRDPNAMQPIDIRVEDLRRNDTIPNQWLKFGSYSTEDNEERYLWIDTDTHEVFATSSDLQEIKNKWIGLDECLSDIFLSMK